MNSIALSPATKTRARNCVNEQRLLVDETELGCIGVVMIGEIIDQIKFGFANVRDAVNAVDSHLVPVEKTTTFEKRLLRLLQKFASGKRVDFSSIQIDMTQLTPFQVSVTRHCRRIGHGTTLSYGELAAKAGSPGAARAVGSVMSKNRVPIVVPCHRVIGAGGSLGGYSAMDGPATKRRLLQMEGVDF